MERINGATGLARKSLCLGSGIGAPAKPREDGSLPKWPYTWGRVFRFLSFPISLLYRIFYADTVLLDHEYLTQQLPGAVIFAGTHHSFADMSLVHWALGHSAAGHLRSRLLTVVSRFGFASAGLFATYGIIAFGLYPLRERGEGHTSIAELAGMARQGHSVLIFPQGKHVLPEQERTGDPKASFKKGAAYLAKESGLPVVPFGLAGTEKAIPPQLEGFHGTVIAGIPVSLTRCQLTIAFGAPLVIGQDESPEEFTTRLQDACFALTRKAEWATGEEPLKRG